MTYLLDTDHVSVFQRPGSSEHATLIARMTIHPPTEFAFSIVSYHEQMLGAHTRITAAKDSIGLVSGYRILETVRGTFGSAIILPFDDPAAAEYDRLTAAKIRIGVMDLRIAAIALSKGLTVLTRNSRDFGKVPGLNIEDWTR